MIYTIVCTDKRQMAEIFTLSEFSLQLRERERERERGERGRERERETETESDKCKVVPSAPTAQSIKAKAARSLDLTTSKAFTSTSYSY